MPDILETEEAKLIKNLSKDEKTVEKSVLSEAQISKIQEVVESIIRKPTKTEITNDITAKVAFPESQKVHGGVTIIDKIKSEILNFPSIFKVEGRVKADVEFPATQKVEGNVTAKVEFPDFIKIFTDAISKIKFPDVQKIMGKVEADVKFPATQKVDTGIPYVNETYQGKEPRPDSYVPVRLTTGKAFYDLMSQSMSSNGRLGALIEQLLVKMDAQSASKTLSNGTKTVPTGTSETIGAQKTITSVIVKSLSTNTAIIYVGASGVTTANGLELQIGESISIAVDDLSKVFVISGTASQVVRYITA